MKSEYSPDGIEIAFEHRFNPIGTVFAGNTTITNLGSLSQFAGLDSKFTFGSIVNCSGLRYIRLPEGMKTILYSLSRHSTKSTDVLTIDLPSTLKTFEIYWFGADDAADTTIVLIVRAKDPPVYAQTLRVICQAIYVPDDSVEAYQSAESWNVPSFQNRVKPASLIRPLSEFHP